MKGPLISGHTLLAAIFIATSVTARSPNTLFERQASCPKADHNKCTQAGLPDNFCCPVDTACIPLAGNTTVLCCPNGSKCNTIKPITCDITAQNVTLHNDNTLKTTALTVPLLTCGENCCPFGFSCNGAGNCVMNVDQKAVPAPPASSPSSSPSSPTLPATTSTNLSPTSSSAPSTNTPALISQTCNNFPTTAVLTGFFPGLALGILLSVAGVCILGSRRRKAARRQSGSSFGNISGPQPSNDMRTDFLRKPPQTPSTVVSSTPERRQTVQRMKSIFRKTANSTGNPRLAPPLPLNVSRPMAQNNRPVTPPLQREPSYEDINIFADDHTASSLRERERANGNMIACANRNRNESPSGNGGLAPPRVPGMRDSHQTTFSDMMERSGLAGLQKGQPYVYKRESPGYTPPR